MQSTEKSAFWRLVPRAVNRRSMITRLRPRFSRARDPERGHSKIQDRQLEMQFREPLLNVYFAKADTKHLNAQLMQTPILNFKLCIHEIIAEQERRGFIEKVDNYTPPTGQVHYIPHHPVKNETAIMPIRIVYDCSCRKSPKLPSLNDCLESTPPILNDLTSILVRFRIHSYAVTTDIEKAFLHIGPDEKDRDATRFLWSSDISNPESQLSIYRFKSVSFGATCSPFILSATILKRLENNKGVRAADVIERDVYIDNVLSSFDNESDIRTSQNPDVWWPAQVWIFGHGLQKAKLYELKRRGMECWIVTWS